MVTETSLTPPVHHSQRLLATPPLLDPTGVRALRRAQPDVDKYAEYGFCLINLTRLAELETLYFPHTPSQVREAEGSALCARIVVQQITTFLERIDAHWFPVVVDEGWACEIEPEVAWALQNVPLFPQGLEYEHPDELCTDGVFMGSGIVDLLMCLAVSETWVCHDSEFEQRIHEQMHATYPEIPPLPDKFCLTEVVPLLNTYPLPAPFNDLADVCRLVLYETGNSWLDTTYTALYENYPSEWWENMEGMDFLREMWRNAQPVIQARDRLEMWADGSHEHADSRHRQIVQLLVNRWEIRNGQMVLPLVFE